MIVGITVLRTRRKSAAASKEISRILPPPPWGEGVGAESGSSREYESAGGGFAPFRAERNPASSVR